MAGAPRSDARTPPRAQGVTADHLPPPPPPSEKLCCQPGAKQSRTGFSCSPRPGSPFKAAPEVPQPELHRQQVGVPRVAPRTPSAQRGHPKAPSRRGPAALGGGGSGRGAAGVAPSLRGGCGAGCWRRLSQEMRRRSGRESGFLPAMGAVLGHCGRGDACPRGPDTPARGGCSTVRTGLAPSSRLERS